MKQANYKLETRKTHGNIWKKILSRIVFLQLSFKFLNFLLEGVLLEKEQVSLGDQDERRSLLVDLGLCGELPPVGFASGCRAAACLQAHLVLRCWGFSIVPDGEPGPSLKALSPVQDYHRARD